MLVDAVILNDELSMLGARLELLGAHVDHFVVAESRETFSGLKKPLYLSESLHLFPDLASRITIVEYVMPSAPESRWQREQAARNALRQTLVDLAPDGVVMLCDVDEIPSAEQCIAARQVREPSTIPLSGYFRRANWRVEYGNPWLMARAVPVRQLPDDLGALRWDRRPDIPQVGGEVGEHFSYMGVDADALARKYRDFSHAELDFTEASSKQLLTLADAMVVDHLGRAREQGRGLLTLQPISAWSSTQARLYRLRPEWFDPRRRPPPRLLRRLGATLIDGIVNDRRPGWSDLLTAGSRRELLMRPASREVLSTTARREWLDLRPRAGSIRRSLLSRVRR